MDRGTGAERLAIIQKPHHLAFGDLHTENAQQCHTTLHTGLRTVVLGQQATPQSRPASPRDPRADEKPTPRGQPDQDRPSLRANRPCPQRLVLWSPWDSPNRQSPRDFAQVTSSRNHSSAPVPDFAPTPSRFSTSGKAWLRFVVTTLECPSRSRIWSIDHPWSRRRHPRVRLQSPTVRIRSGGDQPIRDVPQHITPQLALIRSLATRPYFRCSRPRTSWSSAATPQPVAPLGAI